jgi:hypothetical protein
MSIYHVLPRCKVFQEYFRYEHHENGGGDMNEKRFFIVGMHGCDKSTEKLTQKAYENSKKFE